MRRLTPIAVLIGSCVIAGAAPAVDVCGLLATKVSGFGCPIRPGATFCVPVSAKTGPCDTALRCFGGKGFFCHATLVPRSGPAARCPASSRRLPSGLTCARQAAIAIRTATRAPTSTDTPTPTATATPPGAAVDPNDLRELTDDALAGRNNDTQGSRDAQAILIRELIEMGAIGLNTAQTGDDAFKQPFVQDGTPGTNIVAVIPGSELPNEYVMVGAHYDHLSDCRTIEVGDTVCNGATDNAAGAVVTLAIGRAIAALPTKPRRSVALAFWDAEEDGLLGSAYYVSNPLVPLTSTITYINFDIQGANLVPSVKNYTFAVGAELGVGLGALVQQAASDSGSTLDTRLVSYIFGQFRSDYVNFGNNGVVTVFFSDSTGPCYHSNDDELAIVDMDKLQQQTRMGHTLTLALADTATPPPFMSPNPSLATFADAQIIDEVFTVGLADLSRFSAADQMRLMNVQAEIAAMVADGPGNFDAADVITLLLDTVDVIDLLSHITCEGFF